MIASCILSLAQQVAISKYTYSPDQNIMQL